MTVKASWLMSWVTGSWKVQLPGNRSHNGGREPAVMSSVTPAAGPIHLGMDTSKNTLLASMGVACDVVAPSLIPRRAGDRVKTGKRDASRLARLHRAGELTPVRVPSAAEEAVRDLVRVRAALLADRKRAQQRLTAMLLRHARLIASLPASDQTRPVMASTSSAA